MTVKTAGFFAICVSLAIVLLPGEATEPGKTVDEAGRPLESVLITEAPSVVARWLELVLEGKLQDAQALTTNSKGLDAEHDLAGAKGTLGVRIERTLGNESLAVVVSNTIKHPKSGKLRAYAFWLVRRDAAWRIDLSYGDDPENIEQQLSGLYQSGSVKWHVPQADLIGTWLAGPGKPAGTDALTCGSRFKLMGKGKFTLEAWGPFGPEGDTNVSQGTWQLDGDLITRQQGQRKWVSRISWVDAKSIVLQSSDDFCRDGKYGTYYQPEQELETSTTNSTTKKPAQVASDPSPPPVRKPPQPQRDAPRFNPANGHDYAYREVKNITWTDANDAASRKTFRGRRGHLVTITSAEENAFLLQHWHHRRHAWIGATDVESEGNWRWVTGPEAGRQFWSGNAAGSGLHYSGWKAQEPNDSFPSSTDPPDEDYAVFNFERGGWNDLPNDPRKTVFRPHAYIVEFSDDSEP